MVSALISRLVVILLGTLYPAYASFKAVKSKNVKEYLKWMMYWIVFAFFSCIETFADIFISWFPFYYEIKIIFVLWLLMPGAKGASILYRKFIHPHLAKREKDIDSHIAKISDQGYSALLSLGSRGLNYATNIVVSTAMKGQTRIVDQLKKSYSLSDLSTVNSDTEVRSKHDELDYDVDDNRFKDDEFDENFDNSISKEENTSPLIRRRRTKKRSDLHSLGEEDEEESELRKDHSKKNYSTKEAFHYATLPRTRGKARNSVKNAQY